MTVGLAVSVAAAGGTLDNNCSAAATQSKMNTYYITETGVPTSLDPLDADNAQNLAVARMIYATPLEISGDNEIASGVLDSFKYNTQSHRIEWVVKKGLSFSDGTPLTADDVAFAVARMAFTRPAFPVLEEIIGVSSWAKRKDALKTLPSGISVDGQKIEIALSKDVPHPLFRFCLELFSIIPKKCVDPLSNKITCGQIPTSGYYAITERSERSISFRRSGTGPIHGELAPDQIRFQYVTTKEFADKKIAGDDSSIFAGNEQMYLPKDMKTIENGFTVKYMPAARFAALLLNPTTELFKDEICRRVFAETFRSAFAEVTGRSAPVEASVFTKLVPGYLSSSDLTKGAVKAISDSERKRCEGLFSRSKIAWGFTETERSSTFVAVFQATLARLGIKNSEPQLGRDRAEMFDWFAQGKIAAINLSTGFWALDPAGDVKMLFTPGLHKPLKFLSDDRELQNLIAGLTGEEKSYAKLNQYLYEKGLFNVYAHLRRFYASSCEAALKGVHFAISSPAPWQVFGKAQ